MVFFLGIDGGGTKTECALAGESGAVKARVVGPGTNLGRTSAAALRDTLATLFQTLQREAGLKELRCDAVCAGFAGAGEEKARRAATNVLEELLRPGLLRVVGDMEVALEAAVGDGPGVVLIAGTGSIAFGRNAGCETARAGGRGPEASDEGSAYAIGRAAVEVALEAALRGDDVGEDQAALRSAVRAALGITDPAVSVDTLREFLLPERATEVAALVRVVGHAAGDGNPAAQAILQQAGQDLGNLVRIVMGKLGLVGEPVTVATTGGAFAASPALWAFARERVLRDCPEANVVPMDATPAEGALRMAQRLWSNRNQKRGGGGS